MGVYLIKWKIYLGDLGNILPLSTLITIRRRRGGGLVEEEEREEREEQGEGLEEIEERLECGYGSAPRWSTTYISCV
jgi:hypothetical protein